MSEPTIKIQRDSHPRERDYRVLINGEHRATFRSRKRFGRVGYDFQDAYGNRIGLRRRFLEAPTKAEFPHAVRDALYEKAIPTRAQIDRWFLMDQAHKEDQERDQQISNHRAQVRREVLRVAIKKYIERGEARDGEHHRMAERILEEVCR